jgi:hypothetical protein
MDRLVVAASEAADTTVSLALSIDASESSRSRRNDRKSLEAGLAQRFRVAQSVTQREASSLDSDVVATSADCAATALAATASREPAHGCVT